MAFQAKHTKGLSPKSENPGKEGGVVLDGTGSVNNNNNNNAPKYGTVIPNRIFVGGISSATTELDLAQLFSNYGRVTSTKIIADRAGVSKGYGFVTFETEEEAKRLQKDADSIVLRERRLNIAPAIKKQGFVRNYDQGATPGSAGGGCPGNGAGGGGGAQVFHQNGIPYAYHNGMAFFSPTSTSAPVTPIPSTPVDPSLFTGAYANPVPQVAAYSPSMIYPTPIFFPNPQYQFQVPYDGCYAMSEGQGSGTVIVQNGNNGDGSNGGGSNGGGAYQTNQQPQQQQVPQGQAQSQQHYQDYGLPPPHQQVPQPYTCLALPHQETQPLIPYAIPARRIYDPPLGFIEWPNNENRNCQSQSTGRCYQGEAESKPAGSGGGGNECSNGGSIKPDSTAEVSETKPKPVTPVVSLLSLESEEEVQTGTRPPFRKRPNRGGSSYHSGNGKHLNNNNPDAADRNLPNNNNTDKRCHNNPVPRSNPPPHHPPPHHPYPPECPAYNMRPSSLQVPQYPPYYANTRTYYSMVHLPQQHQVNNRGGRGRRYRGGGAGGGGGSSHNSSRSSSSQGRGHNTTEAGSGSGSGCRGEAALTPPTTPGSSPTNAPPSSVSAPTSSSNISHNIQALSI